jgi:hypothetical protein
MIGRSCNSEFPIMTKVRNKLWKWNWTFKLEALSSWMGGRPSLLVYHVELAMWRHIIHFPLWNGFYEFISFKISVAECSLDSYSLAKVCWSFWKTCSTVKLQDEVYGQVSDINFCEYAVFYLYLLSLVFFPVKMFLISFPVSTLVAWCQSLGCSIW